MAGLTISNISLFVIGHDELEALGTVDGKYFEDFTENEIVYCDRRQ